MSINWLNNAVRSQKVMDAMLSNLSVASIAHGMIAHLRGTFRASILGTRAWLRVGVWRGVRWVRSTLIRRHVKCLHVKGLLDVE